MIEGYHDCSVDLFLPKQTFNLLPSQLFDIAFECDCVAKAFGTYIYCRLCGLKGYVYINKMSTSRSYRSHSECIVLLWIEIS